MLALYRADRQADALAAYQSARRELADELGLEPSAALSRLEAAILGQDPDLDHDAGSSSTVYETFRIGGGAVAASLTLPDGQVVTLVDDDLVVVGRGADARIRFVDSRVSRRHAQIECAAGRHLVVDLGSTNGTSVNGVSVTRHLLVDGDVVSAGGVEMVFRAAER
jgi:hypothetical protein